MKKIDGSAALYFILIIMSIFLIIQTRMMIIKENTTKTITNPYIFTNKVLSDSEETLKNARDNLSYFYDIEYHNLHSVNASYLPTEEFLLFFDKNDHNILKKVDTNITTTLTDGLEKTDFSELIKNGTEYLPDSSDDFGTKLKNEVIKMNLQKIKIPITFEDSGRTIFYSPIIRVSGFQEFEIDKGNFLSKFDFSILFPFQDQNVRDKVYFKSYNVNTNSILRKKVNAAIEILDYIANIIVSKQKFFYQDNASLSNVLAVFGASNIKVDSNNNYNINTFGAKEKIGISTSGLAYINFSNIENLDRGTVNSQIPIEYLVRGFSRGTISSNTPIASDRFELDFRTSMASGMLIRDSYFYPQTIMSANHKTTEAENEESILMCGLNTECGVEIKTNQFEEINEIKRIKMGEALKKMFSLFDKDIKSCSTGYYLIGHKNPFGMEREDNNCGSTITNFLIDNSSAFNYGSNQFNPQDNTLIFTLALKNESVSGCIACQKFPFIFKKYYIYKE